MWKKAVPIAFLVGVSIFAFILYKSTRRSDSVDQQQQSLSFKLEDLKPAQLGSQEAPSSAKLSKAYIEEPVTVNLPAGEIFLYVIPGEEAMRIGLGSNGHAVYVTSNRSPKAGERKITFWGPGDMPNTWKPLLYIQEH